MTQIQQPPIGLKESREKTTAGRSIATNTNITVRRIETETYEPKRRIRSHKVDAHTEKSGKKKKQNSGQKARYGGEASFAEEHFQVYVTVMDIIRADMYISLRARRESPTTRAKGRRGEKRSKDYVISRKDRVSIERNRIMWERGREIRSSPYVCRSARHRNPRFTTSCMLCAG